jgi:PAS domain S-box-containing protein
LKARAKAQGGERATGELWSFTQVLRDLPVAVYATDASGAIVFFNEAARKLWGQEPGAAAARYCGTHLLLTPDGRPLAPAESPVALLLKGEQPIRWRHLVAERPDGSRVPFAAFPSLLKRPDGSIYGAVNTLLDLTEHERADAASVRLAAIVESSSDAIISKDLGGILRSWNRAAELLFGYTAEEAVGRPITMLIPADRQEEEHAIIGRIRRGESVKAYETIRQRKDGSLVPVSLTVSPVRDGEGRIVGASKIVRDISVRVENQQRMRHLMRELNHRVKNQYAVILSMIRETRTRSRTPDQFERQVRERIMALAASHDLLVSEDWKWTTLFELLLTQLKPFGHEARFTISGPPIRIRPNAVQHLGIAFHELGANALVYGALATVNGAIRVSWERLEQPDRPERIVLVWEETGSRPAAETLHKGFGSVVLERIVPNSLCGTASLTFGPDGFTWRLEAPASAMLPESDGTAEWREY